MKAGLTVVLWSIWGGLWFLIHLVLMVLLLPVLFKAFLLTNLASLVMEVAGTFTPGFRREADAAVKADMRFRARSLGMCLHWRGEPECLGPEGVCERG